MSSRGEVPLGIPDWELHSELRGTRWGKMQLGVENAMQNIPKSKTDQINYFGPLEKLYAPKCVFGSCAGVLNPKIHFFIPWNFHLFEKLGLYEVAFLDPWGLKISEYVGQKCLPAPESKMQKICKKAKKANLAKGPKCEKCKTHHLHFFP